MVLNEKSIVGVIDQLTQINAKPPCKKTIQKIVYLLEEAGENLGYKYSIHFYGPYSAELDYRIQELSAEGVLKIEYTEHGHLISKKQKSLNFETETRASSIIQTFGTKTPSDLELLATALFVQRETDAKEKTHVISGVKKIKGTKYSDSQITGAIQTLESNGYFSIQ